MSSPDHPTSGALADALREVTRALADNLDEWRTLELAVRATARLLSAPYARIWLVDGAGQLGRSVTFGAGMTEARLDRLPMRSVAGLIAQSGDTLVLTDVQSHPDWRDRAFVQHTRLRAYLGVPLRRAGETLGVLEAMRVLAEPFGPGDTDTLLGLADAAAVAVANARQLADISRDITERKRIEAALRRREQEFAALVEHAPDAIARFDRGARFTYLNPAVERLATRAASDIRGRTIAELGAPEAIAAAWEIGINQVFASGREVTTELTLPTRSGERTLQARLAPEFGTDGIVEHVLCVARDMTDRARAEAERTELYRELLGHQQRLHQLTDQVLLRAPAQRETTDAVAESRPSLTSRESAVVQLMVRGYSNPAIGRELHVSAATVKTHVASVLSKLQVTDRTQAAVRAVTLGLASAA